ncbi:MAG: mandelate racemase/muconate lactonizing enzyme family protein, partial [bacterium]
MRSDRRRFMSTALGGSLAAALPALSCSSRLQESDTQTQGVDYSALDEVLRQPVLRKDSFTSPVIIETLELLRRNGSFLCRVRSIDGAEGFSVGHSGMSSLYPIFVERLQPFFIGKDARDLDLLLEKVYIYSLNFRLSGMALGIPLATIEFAILDMLGRISGKSMGQL